ncbi:MAG: hypothetical protein BWY28_02382 [bacterium ADurb.Bin236]|nr:MAG: hypothetical protein BWY28_02382 [bacterium ADurb.Bin236]
MVTLASALHVPSEFEQMTETVVSPADANVNSEVNAPSDPAVTEAPPKTQVAPAIVFPETVTVPFVRGYEPPSSGLDNSTKHSTSSSSSSASSSSEVATATVPVAVSEPDAAGGATHTPPTPQFLLQHSSPALQAEPLGIQAAAVWSAAFSAQTPSAQFPLQQSLPVVQAASITRHPPLCMADSSPSHCPSTHLCDMQSSSTSQAFISSLEIGTGGAGGWFG